MKRIALLWSLVTLVVLAGCQPIVAPATPAPDEAQSATQDDIYSDPQGRFTVPIPANWTATTRDGYALLTSPQDEIEVAIVVLPDADPEAAVAQAWTTVDPVFDTPVLKVTEVPPYGGVERVISVDYDTGESDVVMVALGLLADGNTYALLFRGDLIAVSQRSAQLSIIQTGFQIAGIEGVDLAGVQPLPFNDEIRAELESYIERKLTEFGVPGVSVAVVQDGEIVYAQGFGVRELGKDAPVTPETLMMVGSTGKTMTTMMMATVVDDGLVSWDTPVQEVLSQFSVADPELSQQITMRNLVCACTGVPRRDLQLIFNADELSAEDIVESLQEFEFFTEFGEAFQYSNQLVATGGYAAAAATGAAWGSLYEVYVDEMQARIFDPIGMENTTFSFDEVVADDNYALPHTIGVEVPYELAPLSMERVVEPVAPAGAAWSNVLDMARYLLTELDEGVAPDGTRVVSTENLAETWEPQVPVDANASYGLGWFVDEYKGQRVIHHGGNTFGYTSDLAFLPDAGVGITILTNGRATDALNQAVRFRLLELLFEQPEEYDAQADFVNQTVRGMVAEPVAETVPVTAEAVEPFLGRYHNDELGGLEMVWADETLFFDVGEFSMEVRALPAEEETAEGNAAEATATPGNADTTGYVIYGAPMTGLPLHLEMGEDGQPQVIFGMGVDEYTFTPVVE
jgi:CubicO group peptidase (beta-lactamase class C family)